MLFGYLILLMLCIPSCTSAFESIDGGSVLACYLDGISSTNQNSFALARMIEASLEKPANSGNGFYHCQALKNDSSEEATITLEIASMCDFPQQLSIQVADMFINSRSSIAGTTISCHFTAMDDSQVDRHNKLDGAYHCDGLGGLNVIFSGTAAATDRSRRSVRSKSTQSDRERRSDKKLQQKSPENERTLINAIACSSGMLPSDFVMDELPKILGQVCTIRDDEYHKEIGRIWVISSNGTLKCLPCCVNFFFNNETKQCEHCVPGTEQPFPGFWSTCQPIRRPIPKDESLPQAPTPSTPAGNTPTDVYPEHPLTAPVVVGTPQPELKSPVQAPANLTIAKFGLDYATISWNEVSELEIERVTKYKIILTCMGWKTPRVIKTEDAEKEITLHSLDPGTTCNVKLLAGNSNGFGPESESVEFNTMHKLKALKDLGHSRNGNVVRITWNIRPHEKDLQIMVKFWKDESILTKVQNANGTVIITLPGYGDYHFEVFYINVEQQDVPKSRFIVVYEQTEDETKGTDIGIIMNAVNIITCVSVLLTLAIIFVTCRLWIPL